MRRSCGPRGSAARKDVWVAADSDAVSEKEDFGARAAYRKAKKEKSKEQGGDDRVETGRGKSEDGRRTLNAFKRKTGARNR